MLLTTMYRQCFKKQGWKCCHTSHLNGAHWHIQSSLYKRKWGEALCLQRVTRNYTVKCHSDKSQLTQLKQHFTELAPGYQKCFPFWKQSAKEIAIMKAPFYPLLCALLQKH